MATKLEGGYAEARKRKIPGSGATPGARPETKTPLEKIVGGAQHMGRQVVGMIKRLNQSGNNMSPTTTKDQPLTPAQLEDVARKYVD